MEALPKPFELPDEMRNYTSPLHSEELYLSLPAARQKEIEAEFASLWFKRWDGWYRENGLVRYRFDPSFKAAGYSLMLCTDDVYYHACVALDGNIIHDPQPPDQRGDDWTWRVFGVEIIVPRSPAVLPLKKMGLPAGSN